MTGGEVTTAGATYSEEDRKRWAHRGRVELARALAEALETMPPALELRTLSLRAAAAADALLDELPSGVLLGALRRRLGGA